MYLRSLFEVFLLTAFVPPQKINTSLLDKFEISLIVDANDSVLLPGFA